MKVDELKIKNDKRKKLTDHDKQMIKYFYEQGHSIGSLARRYNVNKRTIQFLLFPERLEHNKELRKQRLLLDTQRYYDKEEHKKAMQDLRRRKIQENIHIFQHECPICHSTFIAKTNVVYCCRKCAWTAGNRRKSMKKD